MLDVIAIWNKISAVALFVGICAPIANMMLAYLEKRRGADDDTPMRGGMRHSANSSAACKRLRLDEETGPADEAAGEVLHNNLLSTPTGFDA